MDKQRRGKIIMFSGIGVILVVVIIGALLNGNANIPHAATVAIMLTGIFAGLTMIAVGEWMYRARGKISANKRKYKNLPYREISDFKAELEKLRAAYAADNSPNKNKIPKTPFKSLAAYYDFSVLKSGRIYYAYLVEANDQLFVPQANNTADVMPAVFIYSTDPYFEEHPYDLQPISEKLFADRYNNILRNEREYFYNVKVDEKLTFGREVYMTTIMVSRAHLPLGYISGNLAPVIADPLNCTSAFIVDVNYWPEDLGCHIANGLNHKKILQSQIDAYDNYPIIEIENYAYELAAVKENFLADVEDYEDEEDGDETSGELEKENKEGRYEFYYACVLNVDKKLNDPFGKRATYPAVILYSPDEEFRYDPRGLEKIAAVINGLEEKERNEKLKQAGDVKNRIVTDVPVPTEWTEGKRVFLSGVLICRSELPKLSISGNIMPVVKINGEDEGTYIYSVDKDYWTKGLISQFVHSK